VQGDNDEVVRESTAQEAEAESAKGRMEETHGEAPRHARREEETSEHTFNRGSHGTAQAQEQQAA
jgi:hypothetical protein